ncbi:MAG TPA: hypothetical protein VJ816_10645 [Gemmatimonadales bacterium]|nr:hypothetical protein [Gemmatimonadales bacterium]
MNDDRFESLLREAAAEYHRPPETPRDEMWTVIETERRRRRTAPAIVPLRPVWQWGIAMAAVLLVGIAIGRWIRPTTQTSPPSPLAAQPGDVAYRLAAAQYLGRTETLLAGFREDAPSGRVDLQFIAQARDLLSSARLLLDSPAGKDPQLRPLLKDLELVLAQIASLPAGRQKRDVEFIIQGIDQKSMLTRLRTAIPSGPAAPPSTQGAI